MRTKDNALCHRVFPTADRESLIRVIDQTRHSSINVTVDIYEQLATPGNRAAVSKLHDAAATPAA